MPRHRRAVCSDEQVFHEGVFHVHRKKKEKNKWEKNKKKRAHLFGRQTRLPTPQLHACWKLSQTAGTRARLCSGEGLSLARGRALALRHAPPSLHLPPLRTANVDINYRNTDISSNYRNANRNIDMFTAKYIYMSGICARQKGSTSSGRSCLLGRRSRRRTCQLPEAVARPEGS